MQQLMRAKGIKLTFLLGFFCFMAYGQMLQAGAEQINRYRPLVYDRTVAVVANPTSTVAGTHLVDTLLSLDVDLKKVFALEHGFRGDVPDGEKIADGKDPKTGLPIVSLYGSHKKPTAEDLKGIDVVIFDIQDVGVRFYTFVSSMSYIMEACADNGVQMIVLDRPNPNGFYVDGPMNHLPEPSFIGLHPVPAVHGLTLGEYATMAIGEGWLNTENELSLTVVTCRDYTHETLYELPIPPSPNLRSMPAIYLYPSLCYFEGTSVSVGRGTDTPFQIVGAPWMPKGTIEFTPEGGYGSSSPKHEGELCHGYDLTTFGRDFIPADGQLNIFWLIDAFRQCPEGEVFFSRPDYFDLLAGGPTLREQIESGMTEEQIRASWQAELEQFKYKRKQYLLYPDFEDYRKAR